MTASARQKHARPFTRIRPAVGGLILPLLLLLTLTAGCSRSYARFEPVFETLAGQLAADTAADSLGGIVAAVFEGERVIWAGGFGWADAGNGIAAAPAMISRTGSISKSFTAVALMQLVDEGVIDLDDPAVTHLPALADLAERPAGTPPITFRQLASHTAGLIREPRLPGAAAGPIEAWEEKIVASIPTTTFRSPPGTEYSYSNIGFGILGLAISRAAGTPFTRLVEERIFRPLGMSSSTFVITPDLQDRLAVGYANNRRGEVNTEQPAREHAGRGYKVPNGGIYSTVSDLARFAAALCGESRRPILTESARAEMLRFQTPPGDPAADTGEQRSGYGLGFSLTRTVDGIVLAGHGGSVAGYTAHLLFEPESALGVVLLRNYNSGATNLGRTARDILTELVRIHRAERGEGGR